MILELCESVNLGEFCLDALGKDLIWNQWSPKCSNYDLDHDIKHYQPYLNLCTHADMCECTHVHMRMQTHNYVFPMNI